MLDLRQIESFYPDSLKPFKRNLAREYLQYKILEIIFSSNISQKLIFMGGTALHIAYSLPRFSEDLDFDNKGLDKASFKQLTLLIQKKLKLEGYEIEVKNSLNKVFSASLRVVNILYEMKLSRHKQEKVLIKLDTQPQDFLYQPEEIILNKFDVFTRINVVPLDILLAQKIYAIFMRKRPMGRDFFDTIYLLARTKPNLDYLKAKLKIDNFDELKANLIKRCQNLDFKQLSNDVEQFLFNSLDAKKVLLFVDYIRNLTF
ncbi:MAG: nucleotidyl transferase AbiEii/AbiGii toxin family protein [Candidatus Omnitrophota bacterium]